MRRLSLMLAIAAIAIAILAASASAGSVTRGVGVCDDYFKRGTAACGPSDRIFGTLTIRKNDYVKWVWRGESTHHIYVDKLKYDSGERSQGATFKRRFRRLGTFTAICTIHPSQEMRIRVK